VRVKIRMAIDTTVIPTNTAERMTRSTAMLLEYLRSRTACRGACEVVGMVGKRIDRQTLGARLEVVVCLVRQFALGFRETLRKVPKGFPPPLLLVGKVPGDRTICICLPSRYSSLQVKRKSIVDPQSFGPELALHW
jgi:hypothetical protein